MYGLFVAWTKSISSITWYITERPTFTSHKTQLEECILDYKDDNYALRPAYMHHDLGS
jgi:hypothetical protein